MKTVIEMAREAGFITGPYGIGLPPRRISSNYTTEEPWMLEAMTRWTSSHHERLKQLEALIRADEREQGQKWFDAVTAQHKQAILAEREACAKVAEDSDHVVEGRGYYDQLGNADATVKNIVAAIRARSNI